MDLRIIQRQLRASVRLNRATWIAFHLCIMIVAAVDACGQTSPGQPVVIKVLKQLNVSFAVNLSPGAYTITWSSPALSQCELNVDVIITRAGKSQHIRGRLQPGAHRSVAITTVEAYGAERLYAIHMPAQDLIFKV